MVFMKNSFSIFRLSLISKFSLHHIFSKKKHDLSNFFWNTILDYNFFSSFIKNKYIPYKTQNKTLSQVEIRDIKFILKKLNSVKSKIDLVNKKDIFPQDLFFSYILFNKILSLYNEYYKNSWITISLLKGLKISYKRDSEITENLRYVEDVYLNKKNYFIYDFIYKFFENNWNLKDNKIYLLTVFWPEELFQASIVAYLIKKHTNNSKIFLSFWRANEQFDFVQLRKIIKENVDMFSKYFDFFSLYKDFWYWLNLLLNYFNYKNIAYSDLKWIIDISNWKYKEFSIGKEDIPYILEKYKKNIYNRDVSKLFGSKVVYGRMLPYRCYWSKCNFCTINSNNFLEYNKDYKHEDFIDIRINFIKKYNIYCVVFIDESVHPSTIIKFAEKVIKNNLNIVYKFRTRFEKEYLNKEVCELLYKSWARYCGIWLESVSKRINEDIWNKGQKHISLEDKLKIIYNFDNSWISFHNYSIIGFPTETKKESVSTYSFWIKNIKYFNYYTCTPNVFSLNSGSYIYKNLDNFWICLKNVNYPNPLDLNFDFYYKNWKERELKFYYNLVEKTHIEQFLPWLEWNKEFYDLGFSARDFWDYIDRSGYFYKMKIIYSENPYRKFNKINEFLLQESVETILSKKYVLSNWLEIVEERNWIYCYDWINFIGFNLTEKFKSFFQNFNEQIVLRENLKLNSINLDEKINHNLIMEFLRNRILIINEENGYQSN